MYNGHIPEYRRRYCNCAASWMPCESRFDFRKAQDICLFKKKPSPAQGISLPPPQQKPRTFVPENEDDGE